MSGGQTSYLSSLSSFSPLFLFSGFLANLSLLYTSSFVRPTSFAHRTLSAQHLRNNALHPVIMSDAAATPAKKAAPKAIKPAKPATHPKFSEMITAAITSLKDKKGSSIQAIKKYILASYKVEEKSVGTFTKNNLKRMVESGALKQVKGSGASGSFKLAEKPKAAKKPAAKKAAAKKPAAKKAPKKPAAKKTGKSPAKKVKKPAAKKAAKKSAKSPAKKAAKKPAAKKTGAKKAAKK